MIFFDEKKSAKRIFLVGMHLQIGISIIGLVCVVVVAAAVQMPRLMRALLGLGLIDSAAKNTPDAAT